MPTERAVVPASEGALFDATELLRDVIDPELVGEQPPRWAVRVAAPIVARERVVCLLYADNGDAPVSARRIGDLLLVAGFLGNALERVVRSAKAADVQGAASAVDEGGWCVRELAEGLLSPLSGSPEPGAPGRDLDSFQVLGPRKPDAL